MTVLQMPPRSFMQITRPGLGLCALVLLAACGGGGDTTPVTRPPITGPQGPTDPTPPPKPGETQTGAQMRSSANALIDDYDPITYTALSTIPASGSATYTGYFFGNLDDSTDAVTDTLIGTMSMQVGFTPNSVTVSGSVTDFVDSDNEDVTGSLTLSGGSLNRGGNPSNDATLRASANGVLTDDGGRQLTVGTALEGDFLASGHRAVGGEALGKVTVGGVDQDFDGGFIAER